MNFLQLISVALFLLMLRSFVAADDFADVAAAGIKLYEEGRYEDALQKFKEARRLSPEDRRIDYNMGNINYQLGRFEEARKNWKDAIINVDRSELRQKAYYNMANAFYREKRYREAVRHYKKALQINQNDYEAKFNLELALHQFEVQKKTKKEDRSEKSRQDRKEQESGNDILEERTKSGKKDSNKSRNRLKQAEARNSNGFQKKKEQDSYREKLSFNAAKRYLKTLKEGKCKYRSMVAEDSTNRRHSAQNDW